MLSIRLTWTVDAYVHCLEIMSSGCRRLLSLRSRVFMVLLLLRSVLDTTSWAVMDVDSWMIVFKTAMDILELN